MRIIGTGRSVIYSPGHYVRLAILISLTKLLLFWYSLLWLLRDRLLWCTLLWWILFRYMRLDRHIRLHCPRINRIYLYSFSIDHPRITQDIVEPSFFLIYPDHDISYTKDKST